MIFTVTLNPAMDKTVVIERFAPDAVNRVQQMRTDPGGKGVNVSKVIARLGGESVALALAAAAVNAAMKQMNCPRRDGRASAEFLTYLYSGSADALKQGK